MKSDSMSRGLRIHTVSRSATGNWANQLGQRVLGVYATKEESVRRGEELAREAGTNHVVHNPDGTIQSTRGNGHEAGTPRDDSAVRS